MEDARKILDGLNHCLPETKIDAMLDCSTCPYYAPCNEEIGDTIRLPLALVEDMRAYLRKSQGSNNEV